MPDQSQQTVTPAVAPSTETTGSTPAPARGDNSGQQDKVKAKVSGPIGRVWNHVIGQPEGATDTDGAVADRAMIRAYLDNRLKFADGEWFRGKKLDGVTDKLISTLDTNKDGKIQWPEFKAYEDEIFKQLAPGANAAGSAGSVKKAANAGFDAADKAGDGALSMDDISKSAQSKLPEGTDNADLIGQLAGRVTIDAVDRDEGKKPIADRSISKGEWSGAAEEIASGRR